MRVSRSLAVGVGERGASGKKPSEIFHERLSGTEE